MRPDDRDRLAETLEDDASVDRVVREAVDDAVARHRAKGDPVVVWQEGRPVWIAAPPEVP